MRFHLFLVPEGLSVNHNLGVHSGVRAAQPIRKNSLLLSPRSKAYTVLLGALTGVTALSIDMSLPALPALQHDFHARAAAVQLTLSLFLIGYTAGQLVCGTMSDRLGRRPVLLGGLFVYTLAGIGCAVWSSLPMLVALRLLHGLGASVGPVVARAIVRDEYDHVEGTVVLSQMTQVMIVAPLIAPTIGGLLLVHFGWQAIFGLLAVVGVALLALCAALLPESRKPHPAAGDPAPMLAAFRAVLNNRDTARHLLVICLANAGLFAWVSGSPFVLMGVFHVARPFFGVYFAATASFLMFGAAANRRGLNTRTPAWMLRAGLGIVLAAGSLIGTCAWLRFGGILGVVAPVMVYFFGLGMAMPNAIAAAMAPHGRMAGACSSLIGALQTGGGAVSGVCVTAFYNHTPDSMAYTITVAALLSVAMYGVTAREWVCAPAGSAEMGEAAENLADAELETERMA